MILNLSGKISTAALIFLALSAIFLICAFAIMVKFKQVVSKKQDEKKIERILKFVRIFFILSMSCLTIAVILAVALSFIK